MIVKDKVAEVAEAIKKVRKDNKDITDEQIFTVMAENYLPTLMPDNTAEDHKDTFNAALKKLESDKKRNWLLWGGIGLGIGWIVLRKYQGKSLIPFGEAEEAPPWRYRGPAFRRASGSVRIGGLSSHQVRFGRAAKGCGGRGYTQKQFRSCMSRALR